MPGVSSITTDVQRKKFAREFVKNGGNGTKAALAVKPMKNQSARSFAKNALKRPEVKEEIEKAMRELDLNYKYVMQTRQTFIDKGLEALKSGDIKVTASDVHNHLLGLEHVFERLEKHNNENHSSVHLHLNSGSYTENLEQRKKFIGYFNSVLDAEILEEPQSLEETKDK